MNYILIDGFEENQKIKVPENVYNIVDGLIGDANETAFFLRELEYIKSQSYDTKYKDLKATSLLPVSTEADAGAAIITYQSYTKVGVAKIIADYADDAPRVDLYGEEQSIRTYRIGDSYGWDRDEVRRSNLAGKALNSRKADNAKRASDEKVDDIAWNGEPDYGINGLINFPGITEYVVPADGSGSSKEWSSKTPDQVNRDLWGIVDAVVSSTNAKEIPDTMLMPIYQYNYISQTRMTDGNDKTIRTFFMDNNPYITEIDWLVELDGAGAAGTDRYMVYPKDPRNLTLEIPLPYTALSPQVKGYGFEVLTETKTAGVIVYYPLSVAYGDGI